MEFGVPKEIRDLEMRVGLTPGGVNAVVQAGHTVYVERGAGAGCGFSDELYRENGAEIVFSPDEAYGRAEVVVKVARPTAREHHLFRHGQTIMSLFHLPVSSPDLFEMLRVRGITAVSYEMIQEDDAVFPVLLPLAEAAGRMAPIIAGRLLMVTCGGRGTLLSGVPGVPPAAVVVVGSGVLCLNAVRAFLGAGAQVTALDLDVRYLQHVDEMFNGQVTTMVANDYNLRRATRFADVVVTYVSSPARRAPIMLTREMVRDMRPGSVLIDFAIDQGGAAETSRPTTLRNETYVEEGVIHHCVPNVTSLVARTISHAMTNALVPIMLDMGQYGLPEVFGENTPLARGVSLYQGRMAHPEVAKALGVPMDEDLPPYLTLGGVL